VEIDVLDHEFADGDRSYANLCDRDAAQVRTLNISLGNIDAHLIPPHG
jgi:hypothetical protein